MNVEVELRVAVDATEAVIKDAEDVIVAVTVLMIESLEVLGVVLSCANA